MASAGPCGWKLFPLKSRVTHSRRDEGIAVKMSGGIITQQRQCVSRGTRPGSILHSQHHFFRLLLLLLFHFPFPRVCFTLHSAQGRSWSWSWLCLLRHSSLLSSLGGWGQGGGRGMVLWEGKEHVMLTWVVKAWTYLGKCSFITSHTHSFSSDSPC